jgi:cation diffusion facilitator CzcD-associated flavoprotein CzcO
MEENRCKVVVVGGGLAGLAAARMLSGYRGLEDVVVLEADSSLGGRIKHITGLAPWPVEVYEIPPGLISSPFFCFVFFFLFLEFSPPPSLHK